jgi:hypothetical protein
MLSRAIFINFILVVAFALSATGSAQVSVIQGDIQGTDGRRLKGAEMRIERIDTKSKPFTAKTDAKGYYFVSGIPAGAYKISLLVNGEVQFSVGDLKVRADDPLEIDFNMKLATLTLSSPTAKRARHFVWTNVGTGSQLGGRWVEVSQPENPVPGMWNTEQHSGELVREMVRQRINPLGQ